MFQFELHSTVDVSSVSTLRNNIEKITRVLASTAADTTQVVTKVWTSYYVEMDILRSLCLNLANKKDSFSKLCFLM